MFIFSYIFFLLHSSYVCQKRIVKRTADPLFLMFNSHQLFLYNLYCYFYEIFLSQVIIMYPFSAKLVNICNYYTNYRYSKLNILNMVFNLLFSGFLYVNHKLWIRLFIQNTFINKTNVFFKCLSKDLYK